MFCPKCGKETDSAMKFCGSCGYDLNPSSTDKPVEVIKEQKFEFSQLGALTIVCVILLSALSLIGTFGIAIIGMIIWYFLSVHAINTMTYKVKGSVDWAFAIIFTFGIIGYICYWIWYLNKKDNMTT